MFCPQCSADNPASPPAPALDNAIWNPNAAANWSLLFSPAFGAYLHMLNWRSLGQPGRAAAAQHWFLASLTMLLVYVLLGVFMADSRAADAASRGLGFVYLITWYFAAGRSQARYVKEKFGADYPRKPWGRALGLAVAGLAGYFFLAVVVGVIAGLSGR